MHVAGFEEKGRVRSPGTQVFLEAGTLEELVVPWSLRKEGTLSLAHAARVRLLPTKL